MKSDRYDELDYLIGFTVCEKMYNEGVMSFEIFCRINRAMARTVKEIGNEEVRDNG